MLLLVAMYGAATVSGPRGSHKTQHVVLLEFMDIINKQS